VNKLLKDVLKKHGIAVPRKILAMQNSTPGTDTPDKTNVSVAMTTVGLKNGGTALVTMATSKPSVGPSQMTVHTPPTVVTMVTQVPITSASVAAPLVKDQPKKESIAYVAPFIIANNAVSVTPNVTPVVTSVTPTVIPVAASMVQNFSSNLGQTAANQQQTNVTSTANLSSPHQGFTPQLANNLVYSSAQQPLQTLTIPVSSSHVLQNPHTGFSQHSVAAIMKVTLPPGAPVPQTNRANSVSLATPGMGNTTAAILNVQPAVINAPIVVPSTTAALASTPSLLPASNSLLHQHPGSSNVAVAQSASLPTFYVTTAPNQSLPVPKVATQNILMQQKELNDANKNQGHSKNNNCAPAKKAQSKPGVRARTQNTKRKPENETSPATNKRGAAHLPIISDPSMAKRVNTCNSQETQGNMNICPPQEEIMTLQTFNVNALISSITTQGSSPANNIPTVAPTRDDCSKPTAQVSTLGISQSGQVPRLSHSIASLAGLSQSLGQSQPSSNLQHHQQVSQLASGNLSFSAESLLASSEVVLPNIPHITTTPVSEGNANQNQLNSLTVAVAPTMYSTPNEQSHSQSFSNYSAEALIGSSELLGESVIAQETQMQPRPSRTTYSDFSAESLIGSNGLNTSLSYAIDNLISSRSDGNYNSTAMVSVNPNLLHPVKSNVSHDAGANPLQALAALPEMVEQKSSVPSSQPTIVLLSGAVPKSTYGVLPLNSAPTQFTFVNNVNANRGQRDSVTQQQVVSQSVNSTSNVSVSSASFLKHSVDSITSSFYAVSNAGSNFPLGPISTPSSSFQGQGSFGTEPISRSQLSFGSMTNPFSPTRPLFNHSSTMGSFV